jgi:hypothetical protein
MTTDVHSPFTYPEVDALPAVLADEQPRAAKPPRSRVVPWGLALARAADPASLGPLSRIEQLGAVLQRPTSSMPARQAAALELARHDRDEARERLRQALHDAPEPLLGVIAQSLGRIGGQSALTALEAVVPRVTGTPRALARFAQRLIAHRIGEEPPADLEPLPAVHRMDPHDGYSLELTTLLPHERAAAMAALARQPYGVSLNTSFPVAIDTMRSRTIFLFNRALGSPPDVGPVLKAPCILGIAARRFGETSQYSASLLLLAAPRGPGHGVELRGYRTNGTLVLLGEGRRHGDGLAFELRSVARRGALHLHLEGTWDPGGLVLRRAHVTDQRVDVGRPRRLRARRP